MRASKTVGFVAAVLVVLIALSAAVARSATPTAGRNLPVVKCLTVWGGQGVARPAPKAYRLSVSKALAARLAAYSANGTMVVGPRGWACRSIIGGDGSEVVSLSAPGETPVRFPTATPDPQPYGEVADFVPACTGCIEDEACAFFPAATKLGGMPCSQKRHPGEKVVRNSRTAITFTDPPGVNGTSSYSGGRLAVYGTVIFTPPTATANAFAGGVTCAAPVLYKLVFQAALAAFRRDHQTGRY